MKTFLAFIFLSLIGATLTFAQQTSTAKSSFSLFNRTSLSYTFGLNETFNNDKTNALHVKTVIGFAQPKVGFGLGLETGNFRSANSSNGFNFNTIAFSGNLHVLAKPITDEGINFFAKGGVGYAVKIFNGYNKGFTYEAATGLILTIKKRSRYFLEGIYHYQEIDDFQVNNGKLKVKSIGIGIGTWF
ncbi:MAG: hypothetical protein ABIP95_09450 [Pelobium sp.]